MTIAKEFFEKLQNISANEPLVAVFLKKYLHYRDGLTFENILKEYEKYFGELTNLDDKKKLSTIFWEQVKFFGTPIIEDDLQDDSKSQCNVYFLFPKDKLSASLEKPETKKDLYLQGDFHGYGSTKEDKQRLLELAETGIMWHKDSMPKDALVAYGYIQVEPSYRNIKSEPERSPFFVEGEGFSPHTTNAKFPEITTSVSWDEYSTHLSTYPGFPSPEKIFRVSADSKHAHISGKRVDWPDLLSTATANNTKPFVYHATLYSDNVGDLHRSDASVKNQYYDDLYYANSYNLFLKRVSSFSELDTKELGEKPYLIKDDVSNYKIWGYKENTWQLTDIELTDLDITSKWGHAQLIISSEWKPNQSLRVFTTDAIFNTLKQGHTAYLPYANFTRDIQVFKPASGKIDNIIVINDGILYLIAGIMDHFEKMVSENKLSPNTAFVFIHPLPGLTTTLSSEKIDDFNKDPSVKLPGMGVRLVDYKHGIDQYSDFIANKLFPKLKEELNVPDDPNHRVMIGSSMSGTASLYIGLKRPDLFGGVIVQSPSPDNRAKLNEIPREMLIARNLHIHLSCGEFEHPNYAAANDNMGYATELAHKLGIPLHTEAHGHTCVSWAEELERSLPETLNMLQAQSLMQDAYIPGMSIATISQNEIQSAALGCADTLSKFRVNSDTQFWACSLSKPVFAYLVLKLTKDGTLRYDRILMRKEEPRMENMQIGDLVALHEDDQLTIYWIENGNIVNRSFREEVVQSIVNRLPRIGNESTDLKLIQEMTSQYGCPSFLDQALPWDEKLLGIQGEKQPLTPRMILSHQTGLPNEQPVNFKFNPGNGFQYSGEGYIYLQKMIEIKTKKSLEELAQDKIFGPLALKMTRTTFLAPEEGTKAKTHDEIMVPYVLPEKPANANDGNAAASLQTTATDYARFLMACMNDRDFIELITPQIISMEKDIEAKVKGLNMETLKPIDWGLGFGLQKNEEGKVIAAFHWGHGPGARTFFAINLNDPQSAFVYLTNSENGLAITKDIAKITRGDITPIMNFLSEKYDYRDIHSPNWKQYHGYLMKSLEEEKKGNFALAIESYKEAAKIRPDNSQLQYCILRAETENIQKNSQGSINIKMLTKLAGEYGSLKISVVGSEIRIDDGGPGGPRNPKIINDNLFLDGPVILKFNRDGTHKASLLSCHFPNGVNFSFPASKSNKSQLSISAKSIFSHTQSQQAGMGNKKSHEKKHTTSTDDFNITYGKRSSK